MSELIPVIRIVADPGVQARARGLVKTVAEQYAAAMKRGEKFPPIDVFMDTIGDLYLVADGFHRLEACKLAGRTEIECLVHTGGKREAILFSVGANRDHGLRRTNIDKKRAVMMLLQDPEWVSRTNSWIGSQAGVSIPFVERMRVLTGKTSDRRVYRDGRIRKGARLDRKREADEPPRTTSSADDIEELRIVMASRDRVTMIDACNYLGASPRRVEAVAEAARAAGLEINFAPEKSRDEQLEYKRKLQIRELTEAKTKLLEELRQKDVQIVTLTALHAPPIEPIRARRGIGEGKNRQGTPVLVMSDLHVEEKVTLDKTMGLNEYNPEIAKRCIERCAEAFEWFEKEKKHRWDMRQAILAIIGDTFSGWIHAELIEGNFMSPVQAVVWLQDELERMIRTILATTDFEGILVVLKDGNHGRLTQKIRASTRTENSLEWLMFQTLAARFKDEPRLRFQIDDAIYSYVDCYDRTIAFTHGDQFQYQGGVGGLLIPVRRGLNEARKYRPVDTFVMGHFHTFMPLDDVHVNGSLIGVTPYSLSKSIPPERRRQSYFLLDSANWKTDNCPIWLVSEPEPAWKNLPPVEET